MNRYLFTTARLGFRTWQAFDLDDFAAINADREVMRFFQKPLSREETQAMIDRMLHLFEERGDCDCAVDLLFCRREGESWKLSIEPFADEVELPRGRRQEAIARLADRYAARL